MRLRPATLFDIPAIMDLIRRVVPLMRAAGNLQWDDTYPNSATFARDIALQQLWLAEANLDATPTPQIAAIAAITTDQEPEYAQVGWDITLPALVIHRLAVDPRFQGRGLATALLQHAEHLALASAISRLRVDTNTANQVTQRLLPKLGYHLAGEISLGFRPGLRFFCYEKLLELPPTP